MPRTATVPDEEILAAFDVSESPITTVGDLTGEFDLHRDSIRKRLVKMENGGKVRSKKVGSRAVVWWRPDQSND